MAASTIDSATGNLLMGGQPVFPLGLSDPPPLGSTAPSGRDAWAEIAENNPALHDLKPDIEALLVNRVGHAHGTREAEYYIAPIDECYKLVGLIRANWKGLSGGAEVWTEVGRFFRELRTKSEVIRGGVNA